LTTTHVKHKLGIATGFNPFYKCGSIFHFYLTSYDDLRSRLFVRYHKMANVLEKLGTRLYTYQWTGNHGTDPRWF